MNLLELVWANNDMECVYGVGLFEARTDERLL